MTDIKINVFLTSRLLKRLQQSAYAPIRKETGLNQMELQIIFTLNQMKKPATVGDIYKLTEFNKGHISVSVANLAEAGYLKIKNTKKSLYDTYELTKKGANVAQEIENNTLKGRKILFKGFSDAEMQKIQEYFDRMKQNIKEHDEKHGEMTF